MTDGLTVHDECGLRPLGGVSGLTGRRRGGSALLRIRGAVVLVGADGSALMAFVALDWVAFLAVERVEGIVSLVWNGMCMEGV